MAIGNLAPPASPAAMLDAAAAWSVLREVLDPEVPVLSVVELGIVRDVEVATNGAVSVTITPTYSGCPATEAIADAIRQALTQAGAASVAVGFRLSPAWTTDWLGPEAHDKLRRYGIAPPAHWVGDANAAPAAPGAAATVWPIRFHPRGIECPRCSSTEVEQLSAFGATACKALYRCLACREPFDYFKPF